MEAKDFSALRISLASPEQIRSWSYGEVTKPETINYRRLRPEMDGLFCERIFGPTRDWQCYCGKYKNIRYRGIICDKCGVEVTRSAVRRERMGHIELAAPVAHVWYTRRVPSYLGLLLDVSRRNLDRVLYFAQYVVTHVDEDARDRAENRIKDELALKEQELADSIEERKRELCQPIEEGFDSELARRSGEMMDEAQSVQGVVEDLLGQPAPANITIDLQSGETVIVHQDETVANEHITRLQSLVNDSLSGLQSDNEAAREQEIAKTVADVERELGDRLDEFRAKAEKQIDELQKLQSLQFLAENPDKDKSKFEFFLTESRFRELKSRFGNVFQASMGAEAFHDILGALNLKKMDERLWLEVRTTKSKQRRKKATKRLRVVESLRSSSATVPDPDETNQENEPNGNSPEWMILTALPVIPPDLRPMVQLDGGRFATSDLNDLYRRVINRNNRLKHLLDLGAPDVIVRNEKRMLQEAVDSLIDNSQRGKALSRRGRRELKSLSDMLKGKKGRFRRNLLGKRVDYSGRSVIVIGPKLKLHQCGLPKTMALELYRPFVISRLVKYNYASNVKGAKRIIEREKPEVWEVLEEVIKERPVLLNRAPTLHRLGIQAFEPLLVEGKAIQIHPLVCSAFNADFDGDQMAVHVPLSDQAVKEARELMLSTRNLLLPSDGMPVVGPSKDMVLGNYYLTMDPTVEIVALKSRADAFRSMQTLYAGDRKVGIAARSNGYYYAEFRGIPNCEVFEDKTVPDENDRPRIVETAVDRTVQALLDGEVDCMLANAYEMRKYLRDKGLDDRLEITNLHERRVVVDMDEVEYLYRIGLVNLHTPILLGSVYERRAPQPEPEICTVGRAIFNRILPDEMRFVQETLGKKGLQELVARCYQIIGAERTSDVVDAIKNYGFHYATISGTTIAVSDLQVPDERDEIMRRADDTVTRADRDFRRGLMTEEERYQITIDEWTDAKDELQNRIQNMLGRRYEPLAIMVNSGSTKGGYGPITQLVGMRGLMAEPSGRIMEKPILSHFHGGMDVHDYFMSTHGARKGLTDTALRTADAGYLTRRLVDVAQDMIVNRWDCNTTRGLVIHQDDDIAGQTVAERVVGRCAAADVHHPQTGELIVARNELIDEEIAGLIDKAPQESVAVRSPLTCDLINGVCVLCYGRDLGTGDMVKIGAAVGIIAAQSIGEPGTQLTLRTFHTGGAAASSGGDITSGLPRVQELFEARQTPKGESVMTDIDGILRLTEREDGARIAKVIKSEARSEQHEVPEGWEIRVPDEKDIKEGAIIASHSEKYGYELSSEWDVHVADEQYIEADAVIASRRQEQLSEAAGTVCIEGNLVSVGFERPAVFGNKIPEGWDIRVTDGQGIEVGTVIAANGENELESTLAGTVHIEGDAIYIRQQYDYKIAEGWDIQAEDGQDIEAGHVIASHREALRSSVTGTVSVVDDEEGGAEIALAPHLKSSMAGTVHIEEGVVYIRAEYREEQEYEIPANARLRKTIADGMQVQAGEQLTEGSRNPHRILRALGRDATQLYLLSEIQEVYRSQGVTISDKHFETVIRKMMCKVQITKSGDSDLLPGELIDRLKLLEINEALIAEYKEPASVASVLLGITKAALNTESYLSAASFQHTIKVLAGAAIEGKVDPLHGLKENVIIGKLIPAGTGFNAYEERETVTPPETLEAEGALDTAAAELGDLDDFENMLSEL